MREELGEIDFKKVKYMKKLKLYPYVLLLGWGISSI